jgi:hypothetical protein
LKIHEKSHNSYKIINSKWQDNTLPKFGSVNGRSMNKYYGTSKQYGCQTGNKLKEKSRDLNRNSSRNKNETMFGSGYENCPEFGVLGGIIFKLDIL